MDVMGLFRNVFANRNRQRQLAAHGAAYTRYRDLFSKLNTDKQQLAVVKLAQSLILSNDIDWRWRRVAVQSEGGMAVFDYHNHQWLPMHLLELGLLNAGEVLVLTSELQNDTHPVSMNPLRRQSVVVCDREVLRCLRGREAVEVYRGRGHLGDEVSCVHGGHHWPGAARESID
mgnify:CR=1 FL=1